MLTRSAYVFGAASRRCLLFAQSASAVSMVVGCLVLVGWAFDFETLKDLRSGIVSMKPNTAICFVILGVGLWLSPKQSARPEKVDVKRKVAAQTCASFVALVGAATLSEYLFGFSAGIDAVLFREALLGTKDPFPGRMAHVTGLNFVILGIALALLSGSSPRGQRLSRVLAMIATIVGLIAIVGYVYSAEALYRITLFSSIAPHTALLFTLMGLAILCAQPDQGLMSTVTSTNLGGSMARRILPMALTLPFLIGWLRLQGQHAGLYGTEFGLAIFTISNVLIFSTLVWLGSRALNKVDVERQRAAVELKEANERLSEQARVLDLAQVLVRDMEDRIVQWNLGAERLYGFSREEAVGRISHELFNTQFPEPLWQIESALRRCGKWEGELIHRKRDGGRLIVASQWIVHRDSSNRATRIVETNTDVSQRKRSEEALSQSEALLRKVTNSARVGLVMLDAERRYRFANTAYAEILGVSAEEIVGRRVPEVLAHVYDQIRPRLDLAFAGERVSYELTVPGGRDAKKNRFYSVAYEPRTDPDGGVGVVVVIVDTTERRQVEEELKCLNESLEQRVRERTEQLETINVDLQKEITERKRVECALQGQNVDLENAAVAKDRFLANMSHELRTPLNGIIGFAEFIVDGKPGSVNLKQKEYLEDILNSGKHLLQLISDVLDLAKVGAGKMELSPERFSLRQAIEEVSAVAQGSAHKKRIQIEVNIAPEIGEVTLDQQKAKQILYNLLSNAIKFNHDGGRVEIRAEPHDGQGVKLAVSDTGIGIKAKDIGRLFKEFEQLDSGASRRHQGTGLGLALTRKMVELQGGTIGVESEAGQGSCFTVILPVVTTEAKT
jgi:PAS domain S-box-containing protein